MNLKVLLIFVFCAAAFSAFAQPVQTVPPAPKDVDVAVPAHDIAKGARISEDDLTYALVTPSRAGSNIIRAIPDIAGKEARRSLRSGELLRPTDLKRPTLVAKGSTVTMVFEVPGMRLTSVGRALSEGAAGESITVLNPVSYRQVEATVTGPGTVRVGAPKDGAVTNELAQAQP